jgi:hypothetical protein
MSRLLRSKEECLAFANYLQAKHDRLPKYDAFGSYNNKPHLQKLVNVLKEASEIGEIPSNIIQLGRDLNRDDQEESLLDWLEAKNTDFADDWFFVF